MQRKGSFCDGVLAPSGRSWVTGVQTFAVIASSQEFNWDCCLGEGIEDEFRPLIPIRPFLLKQGETGCSGRSSVVEPAKHVIQAAPMTTLPTAQEAS